MNGHVVDASVFGPLFFHDEADQLFEELPGLIESGTFIAPQHWILELTNQIITGLRRKRTTAELAKTTIHLIESFPVTIDTQSGARIAQTYALAMHHGLTIYDAAYLELAMRRKFSLISYDRALRAAARDAGVKVLPQS